MQQNWKCEKCGCRVAPLELSDLRSVFPEASFRIRWNEKSWESSAVIVNAGDREQIFGFDSEDEMLKAIEKCAAWMMSVTDLGRIDNGARIIARRSDGCSSLLLCHFDGHAMPWVTWIAPSVNQDDTYWGRYFADEASAVSDFLTRRIYS